MQQKIHLEKVTKENAYRLTLLKVNKEQKEYVAENKWSLVNAYLATVEGKPVYPFGIYLGKKPMGFVMIGYDAYFLEDGDPDILKGTYFIWRMMIDKKYQGKGYGKKAFQLALDFIRTFPAGKSDLCWISYEPENVVAKNLYASFGFEEYPQGYKEGEEMPAILKL